MHHVGFDQYHGPGAELVRTIGMVEDGVAAVHDPDRILRMRVLAIAGIRISADPQFRPGNDRVTKDGVLAVGGHSVARCHRSILATLQASNTPIA